MKITLFFWWEYITMVLLLHRSLLPCTAYPRMWLPSFLRHPYGNIWHIIAPSLRNIPLVNPAPCTPKKRSVFSNNLKTLTKGSCSISIISQPWLETLSCSQVKPRKMYLKQFSFHFSRIIIMKRSINSLQKWWQSKWRYILKGYIHKYLYHLI